MPTTGSRRNAGLVLATIATAAIALASYGWAGAPAARSGPTIGGPLHLAAGGNSTFPGNASTGCANCQFGANDTLPPILSSYSGFSTLKGSSGSSTTASLSGYGGHYWLFGEYSGSSTTTTDVYATMVMPYIGPRSGDLYYVELSIWDNAGHYDQIGVTSDFGPGLSPGTTGSDWNANWVSATNCGTTFVVGQTWDPDSGGLSPGQPYTFDIHLSGGYAVFGVYSGWGAPSGLPLLYQNSSLDSASSLLEQSTTTCNGVTSAGYTVGEEVYNTTVQPFPNWNFNITNNHASGSYVTSWKPMAVCDSSLTGACPVPPSPHGYYVWKMGWAFVEVANQAYAFQNAPYALVTASQGQTVSGLYENAFLVGTYCHTHTCYAIGAYSPPSGWTGSASFASTLSSQPTVSSVSFHVPSNAPRGQYYYFWIQLQMTPTQGGSAAEFTSMMLYVYVT